MEEKRVKPITLTSESGKKYVLEFNRKSVEFAENRGFDIQALASGKRLMGSVTELFHYAFRMHHPNMTKEQTDKILFEDLGGLTDDVIARLVELYSAPYEYLFSDEKSKNSKMTVQM